ncbi:LysR family transcriptional regulator [Bradyrhizobium diazoefficiens]|nr:LysR family transcriptional regulator [Bradyrhizobium diazoefficiens]UCF53007.1 MAG: LysR family transcriptional regulator [Bradyrhizobium sp.]MBR0966058.1 LysR family transcriptional regulator [Bradyrhizobium diazoefficiens]MBR0979433.1 LysR family transcriptional regulator [Bradyrhizobium diazoefficiens]MBR1006414.1 LysR family transcriptional regulator [Bradyrhizobium diazoefficiens]MBR1015229.1 LysR family transcriptional regulator [Bradyrhizobium diazoefficiens]
MIEAAAIRYFREVTESGSIKQAATALRIAPSAISRQVQALEEELSVKLFERGARGMMLTDAGRLLYRYAVDNRHQLDGIRVKVQEFETMRRGQVKFAAVEGMVTNFLSNFVIDLSTDYPGISISMTVVGSRAVAEMVSRNEVDLGLVFGRAPRRELIELARMRQSLCLIASPKHSLAHRESCSVKELAGLRVVVPDPSFGIRQEIDRACANAKVRLEICNETNSLAFAQTLAARTDLATFLPRDTAMPSIEAGRLVAVPLRDKRLEATQVTLVQLASRNMSPSCRLVADLLMARMKASRE